MNSSFSAVRVRPSAIRACTMARSIKRAWPNAMIDMLVFAGTEGALEGNTDVRDIIVVPRRAGIGARLGELTRLWRHYDVALSPIATDRVKMAPTGTSPHSLCLATAARPAEATHPQFAQSGAPPN